MSSSENESDTDYSDNSDNEDKSMSVKTSTKSSNSTTKNTESKNASTPKNDVKHKLTAEDLLSEVTLLQETIDTETTQHLNDVKEHDSKQRQYYTELKRNQKKMSSYLEKLPKLLAKELKCKKKRKTNTGGKKGGILKEAVVPLKLRKYLEIDEDTLLNRPQLFSLLNNKFKEQGFKDPDNGKITIISKTKDAKALGVSKGYTFNIQQGQTFLKRFYDEEKQLSANA